MAIKEVTVCFSYTREPNYSQVLLERVTQIIFFPPEYAKPDSALNLAVAIGGRDIYATHQDQDDPLFPDIIEGVIDFLHTEFNTEFSDPEIRDSRNNSGINWSGGAIVMTFTPNMSTLPPGAYF